jgi:hypothetical protein
MKIEYLLDREVIKAAWNHLRGYTTFSIANARVLYVAAPAICLALVIAGMYSGSIWLRLQGGALLFASLVSIPLHIAFDKWKFFHWLKGNFSLGQGGAIYTLVANDEGIVDAKSNSIETRLAWSAVTRFFQDGLITIIFLSRDNCIFFPTKAMSSEQRAEFDDLVARHLPEGKR